MNLRQMEVFHAIMRSGSVTAAARLLNVSQPAVSATLRHCESQMRMKLFLRIGSRLQPTPEAHRLYNEVAAIFSRVQAVERMTQDMLQGQHGSIVVAGTFPVAHSYLAQAVADFLRERPEVYVSLQSLTHPLLIDRLVSREVELGVTYAPVHDPSLVAETLFESEIACVMPHDHPLARFPEIRASQLKGYPLVSFAPEMIMRAIVDEVLGAEGEAPEIRVRVGLSFTALVLAHAGAGIAIVDPLLMETMPLPGLVCRKLRPRRAVEVLLVRSRNAPLSQVMERFAACVRAVIARRTTF